MGVHVTELFFFVFLFFGLYTPAPSLFFAVHLFVVLV